MSIQYTQSRFPFAGTKESTGMLFFGIASEWEKQIHASLDAQNITYAQFIIIAVVFWCTLHDNESTQADVIHMSCLDKMTVSTSLRKLEQLKIVERHIHSEDARVYGISLTRKGITLAKTLVRTVESVDKEFFGSLSKSEQKTLISLLGTLSNRGH